MEKQRTTENLEVPSLLNIPNTLSYQAVLGTAQLKPCQGGRGHIPILQKTKLLKSPEKDEFAQLNLFNSPKQFYS